MPENIPNLVKNRLPSTRSTTRTLLDLDLPNPIEPRRHTTRSTPRSLLDLPVEIRANIFKIVLNDAVAGWFAGDIFFSKGFSFLLANKAIYYENIDIYYKHLVFDLQASYLFQHDGLSDELAYFYLTPSLAIGLAGDPRYSYPMRNAHRILSMEMSVLNYIPILPRNYVHSFPNLRKLTIADDVSWEVDKLAQISTPQKIQETISTVLGRRSQDFRRWIDAYMQGVDVRVQYSLHFDAVCRHKKGVVSQLAFVLCSGLHSPLDGRVQCGCRVAPCLPGIFLAAQSGMEPSPTRFSMCYLFHQGHDLVSDAVTGHRSKEEEEDDAAKKPKAGGTGTLILTRSNVDI
jgi:hypothetical protein